MKTKETEILDKGYRKISEEQRFLNHPSGNLITGAMELVHNLLTYVKKHAWIKIEDCGGGLCNYHFYNDADSEKLPSFERLREIASKAGKSSSSLEGLSLFGLGTEIAALSCRKRQDSVVPVEIRVVKDGWKYGTNLKYDANEPHGLVPYEMVEPEKCDEENSYYVVLRDCIAPSNRGKEKEVEKLKRKIVDTMPDNGIEIEFINGEEREILKYEDFLYTEKLKGTDNYKEWTFILKHNGEPLTIRIADIADIAKSNEGSKYELRSKCAPDLSGGALRYNGMATICRSWDIINEKIKYHQTYDGIRFEVICGDTIFKEMHRESPAKTKTNMVLTHLKGECRLPITIISVEDGKEYPITYIADILYDFIQKHRNDKKNASIDTTVKKTKKSSIKSVNEVQETQPSVLKNIDCARLERTLEDLKYVKPFIPTYDDIIDMISEKISGLIKSNKKAIEDSVRKTDFGIALLDEDKILEMCYSSAK